MEHRELSEQEMAGSTLRTPGFPKLVGCWPSPSPIAVTVEKWKQEFLFILVEGRSEVRASRVLWALGEQVSCCCPVAGLMRPLALFLSERRLQALPHPTVGFVPLPRPRVAFEPRAGQKGKAGWGMAPRRFVGQPQSRGMKDRLSIAMASCGNGY